MSKYISKKLKNLAAYVPGEQPQDKKYIKLNTNESPFEPSPRIKKAVTSSEVDDLRLYSDPEANSLVKALADYYGVENKNVITSNGSDEILAFIFKTFCDENKPMAFSDVTYGFYKVYAELFDIPCIIKPLNSELKIEIADYYDVNCNIILANPNAQTGLYLELDKIETLVRSNPNNLVIIDEAYIDFGGQSAVELTKKYDNIIVVQTFSKSRNLAGARIGFAVANENLINDLKKVKYSFNPYNLNRLSIIIGREAVLDKDYFKDCTNQIIKNREDLKLELKNCGFTFTDSRANFILARHDMIDGETMYKRLKDKGVLVRHFNDIRINDYVRITVGAKEQNTVLIEKIKEIISDERK